MMLVLKIAFRNIFRNRRRSLFTSFTMVISFVLAAITISVEDGSYDSLIDSFTKSTTGDIQIHRKGYLDSPSIYKSIKENLGIEHIIKKNIKIKSIIPVIKGSALAFTDSTPMPVRIEGNDTVFKGIKSDLHKKTEVKSVKDDEFSEDEDNEPYEIIINKNVAQKLDAKVGDKIYLISQGADGSMANDVFKIIKITEKNNSTLQYYAFLRLKTAQEFFSLYGKVHEYKIRINSFKNALPVSEKINNLFKRDKKYSDVISEPWQVVQKEFYKSMKGDKEGAGILLFIIVLIVAIGVLNTVLMSILERKREFGVLKAIGTRGSFVFKMIMLESVIISILSVLLGIVIFTLVNIYFVKYGIPLGDSAVSVGDFKMSKMNGVFSVKEYILPALTIFISSVIVSLYPAFKESKSKPIDSLRSF